MLAGVKVVDKLAAEAALRDDQRANKKEKKAHKKARQLFLGPPSSHRVLLHVTILDVNVR